MRRKMQAEMELAGTVPAVVLPVGAGIAPMMPPAMTALGSQHAVPRHKLNPLSPRVRNVAAASAQRFNFGVVPAEDPGALDDLFDLPPVGDGTFGNDVAGFGGSLQDIGDLDQHPPLPGDANFAPGESLDGLFSSANWDGVGSGGAGHSLSGAMTVPADEWGEVAFESMPVVADEPYQPDLGAGEELEDPKALSLSFGQLSMSFGDESFARFGASSEV